MRWRNSGNKFGPPDLERLFGNFLYKIRGLSVGLIMDLLKIVMVSGMF